MPKKNDLCITLWRTGKKSLYSCHLSLKMSVMQLSSPYHWGVHNREVKFILYVFALCGRDLVFVVCIRGSVLYSFCFFKENMLAFCWDIGNCP